MKNLIQVELEKLEPQIKWVTNMINEAKNEGGYNQGNSQEMYLRGMYYKLGDKLIDVRRIIRQVTAPVIEEGIVRKNSSGRYELPSGDYFTSGSTIEYFFTYSDGESLWIYSRIEHNGEDYYVVDNSSIQLGGLLVRVKQLPLWD